MPASSRHAALRGCVVTFRANPFLTAPEDALHVEEDGLILITDGKITHSGPYTQTRAFLPEGVSVTHYPNKLISAGFIDSHVHYPQLPVIASWGEELLAWLQQYVFPAEAKFSDKDVAQAVARSFLTELLRNGTTTAAVYCTVHPESVDAFFEESARIGTRMIAGKVLMDRNAPDTLRDTARTGYEQSRSLIERWHGKGRQLYAVTPRFAITSTPEQLELAGDLYRSQDDLFMQTHLSENREEIATVARLFPNSASYLDVYDKAGLVGPRAIFGHGIHLHEHDFQHCHDTGCALAHCPTSNFFLGSGLFRLFDAKATNRPVHVGLGTDVGAGTSLSLLATMGEAYKVSLMASPQRLHAIQAFWLATRGGAEALHLEDRIGTIAPGMEADLCVLDPQATPLLALRTRESKTVADMLFVLMTLGDDRCVDATWVNGQCVHQRPSSEA
ncbi:guanine deaminase [Acetobacter tropicalis NBRC 101654]|uniref:Guanine deaminase n=1 Tax=Acetobacter tropicalis NBRC 101654 TaxID=749388 RepID=F7VA50_9PROT|nr:guanine deaminase [Acetobacter tropicalis]GAA07245.1 guanine deaminase [Acetobacter tropicalis NBRC 101654]